MKASKSFLPVLLTVGILVVAAADVMGCSCMPRSSVCSAFGDAKAVFVGKVIEGKSAERMSDMVRAGTKDLTFTFKVSRGFIGAKADQTIDIHTGFGFGDCGFPFKKGEEYVVYAYQSGDSTNLSTGICTRTTHISRAEEDLTGLDALFKSNGSSVTGAITRYERSSLLGEPYVPVVGGRVKLIRSGDGKVYSAKTDRDGRFLFAGLGFGKYRLKPTLGKGWMIEDYDSEEFLLNAHGCATNDIRIKNETELNVTVVDPNGKPVPSIWVELVPLSITPPTNVRLPEEFTVTNPQGQATFYDTPPGKYTISINFFNAPTQKAPFPSVFAPGLEDRSRAEIFEIYAGTQISKKIEIRVPRSLEAVTLSGIVVDKTGKPVKGAQVNLLDEIEPDICVNGCGETNEKGEFTVTGYVGRRYTIEALTRDATDNPSMSGVTPVFALEKKAAPVQIIVKPIKGT
jgi:hypothetical protein